MQLLRPDAGEIWSASTLETVAAEAMEKCWPI
jgi:hypothetical protein